MFVYDDDPERSLAVQLVEKGWYPGSPMRPTVAFSLEMMSFARYLYLKCNLGAITTIETIASQWHEKCQDIPGRQFVSCFGTYLKIRHFFDHCDFDVGRNGSFDNAANAKTECPCCTPVAGEIDGPLIRIADGFFSAGHRKNAGRSYGMPLIRHSYFQASPTSTMSLPFVGGCESHLRAATQAATADNRFDICGIFATVCPHEIFDDVADIERGEKYALAVAALERLKVKSQVAEVVFFYDIACNLKQHLANNFPHLVPKKSVVPVLHSYCHTASCQAVYSPRYINGIGTVDGEQCERCWSKLTSFVGKTQYMTHENRVDALSAKLDFINREAVEKLALKLEKKLTNIRGALENGPLITNYATYLDSTCTATTSDITHVIRQKAATIRAIDRVLESRIGTTMAAKLKKKLASATSELRQALEGQSMTFAQAMELPDKSAKDAFWMNLEEMVLICHAAANGLRGS